MSISDGPVGLEPLPRDQGLSLIEVMTAVTVLGIGLLGLAAGSGWMIRTSDQAEHEWNRVVALQATVEEVKGLPFDALDSGRSKYGEFQVGWSVVERTPGSVLIRFIVDRPNAEDDGERRSLFAPKPSMDTLDYLRNRP